MTTDNSASLNIPMESHPFLKEWDIFCVQFKDHVTSRSVTPQEGSDSILLFSAGSASASLMCMAQQYGVDGQVLGKILKCVEETCLPKVIRLFDRFRWYTVNHVEIGVNAFSEIWSSDLSESGEKNIESHNCTDKVGDVLEDTPQETDGSKFPTEFSMKGKAASFHSGSHDEEEGRERKSRVSEPICDQTDESGQEEAKLIDTVGYHCHICYLPFSHLRTLDAHRKTKHDLRTVNTHSCQLCGRIFLRLPSMITHIRKKHRARKNQVCQYCGHFFDNAEDCNEHIEDLHEKKGKVSPRRKQQDKSVEDSGEVQKFEANFQAFQCQLCGWRFPLRGSLQNHIVKKHFDEKDRMCRFCGKCFEDPDECRSHVHEHRMERRKHPDFSCGLCGTSFLLRERMLAHFADNHPVEKDCMCTYCGKHLTTETECKAHIQEHEDTIKAQTSQAQDELEDDEETVEETVEQTWDMLCPQEETTETLIKEYKCQMCGQSFQLQASMQSHILRKHHENRDHLCRHCGKYFEKIYECRKHVRTHIVKNKLSRNLRQRLLVKTGKVRCGRCGQTFQSVAGFKSHRYREHYDDKECLCSHCGKLFQNSQDMNRHKRLHVEKKIFGTAHKQPLTDSPVPGPSNTACHLCGKKFGVQWGLETHIRRKHPSEKKRMCRYCGKYFRSIEECRVHVHKHVVERREFRKNGNILKLSEKDSSSQQQSKASGDEEEQRPIQCGPCGKAYMLTSSLRRHILKVHTEKQDVICHYCGTEFEDIPACKEHMKTHVLANKSRNFSEGKSKETTSTDHYQDGRSNVDGSDKDLSQGFKQCGLCESVLSSRKSMLSHIKSIHSKVQDHMCACCGQYFDDPEDCLRHQRPHIILSCDFCPKTFKTKFLRDSHMKRHVNQRDLQCDICGSCFFDRKGLNAHRHRHKNSFNCVQCDKVLCSKNSLRHHMRVHNNHRPYICEVCGKGFTQYTTLRIHREIHTGIKPYACEICGKRTRTKADLSRHMPIHSDKKEHVCNICGKAYRFQSGLFSHKAAHTGIRAYVCKLCGCSYRTSQSLRKHAKTHNPGAKTKGTTVPRVPVHPQEGGSSLSAENVSNTSQTQSDIGNTNNHRAGRVTSNVVSLPIEPSPLKVKPEPPSIQQSKPMVVIQQQELPPPSMVPNNPATIIVTAESSRLYSEPTMVSMPHGIPQNSYNIDSMTTLPRVIGPGPFTSTMMAPLARANNGYISDAMPGMSRGPAYVSPGTTPGLVSRGPHGASYNADEMAVVVALQVLDDMAVPSEHLHAN